MQQRWADIQNIWQKNQVLYVIGGFLAGILFFPAIEALSTDTSELLSGFVPEAVGIAFTVLLIDRLNERRALRQYKEQLVRNAGSRVNVTAVSAIDEIRKRDWLTVNDDEQLLKSADLWEANLKGANLMQANLMGSNLTQADLSFANLADCIMNSAYLIEANLHSAELYGCELRNTYLDYAHLIEARMTGADMRGARLWNADLTGAYLLRVNLTGAKLARANLTDTYLESAILGNTDLNDVTLPDGTKWTPEITEEEMIKRFGVVFADPVLPPE